MGSFYGGEGQSRRDVVVDADGEGITLSLEGGYPFTLSPAWKLEPQAQVIWQHQSLDDADSGFATVSFDTDDAVTGRIGARLEGEFQTAAGLIQPYLKANLWHDFSGDDRVSFGVNPFITNFGGTALELGGGLVASVSQNVSLYATADYTFDVDGEKYTAFEGNVGLSVKW
jgi:autotransporter family porin